MKLTDITRLVEGNLLTSDSNLDWEIRGACGARSG